MTVAVIGGDKRQSILAELLEKRGEKVKRFGIGGECTGTLREVIEGSDYAVLPIPLSRDGKTVYAPMHGGEILLSEIRKELKPGQEAFGGGELGETDALWENLLLRESLTEKGALATAEGAVQLLLEKLPVTLADCPILILGYGRIGKHLSRMLASLGAHVTVAARRQESRKTCEETGIRAVSTESLSGALSDQRAVINTVPNLLLGEKELKKVGKNCFCLELASNPGGFDREWVSRLGIWFQEAPGLPGKTAPETMAGAVLEAIDEIRKERNVCRRS